MFHEMKLMNSSNTYHDKRTVTTNSKNIFFSINIAYEFCELVQIEDKKLLMYCILRFTRLRKDKCNKLESFHEKHI